MLKKHQGKLPSIVIGVFTLLVFFMPNSFENPSYADFEKVTGEVIAVNNDLVRSFGILLQGEQLCTLRILRGSLKGQVVEAENLFQGTLERDKKYVEGDTVFALINTAGGRQKIILVDYYRVPAEMILLCLFVVLLIAFAGWTGARALLSFVFAIVALLKILVPAYLKGYDPILVGSLVTIAMAVAIIALVYGPNRQFLAASLGAASGILATAILALLFLRLFRVEGVVMDGADSLLFTGYTGLNLTRIFISSIFIAASGAITDTAVDIVTAQQEIRAKRPDLSKLELMKSGFVLGRNTIATMTTTLLLAYFGGYISQIMVFVGQGIPLISILNYHEMAGEILNTFVGSIGLILVAPLTAIIGAALLTPPPETA